jgi:hypothetical protein
MQVINAQIFLKCRDRWRLRAQTRKRGDTRIRSCGGVKTINKDASSGTGLLAKITEGEIRVDI